MQQRSPGDARPIVSLLPPQVRREHLLSPSEWETQTTECKETKKYKHVYKPDMNSTVGPNFTESPTIRVQGSSVEDRSSLKSRLDLMETSRNGAVFHVPPLN